MSGEDLWGGGSPRGECRGGEESRKVRFMGWDAHSCARLRISQGKESREASEVAGVPKETFHVRVLRSGVPQTEAYPQGGLPPGLPMGSLSSAAVTSGDRSGDQIDHGHLTTQSYCLYLCLHPTACRMPLTRPMSGQATDRQSTRPTTDCRRGGAN